MISKLFYSKAIQKQENMYLKIAVIGDRNVGKSSFIHRLISIESPDMNSVFNNYTFEFFYEDAEYHLNFWDSSGMAELANLKVTSYFATDLFIICYAIDNIRSFKNVQRYINEVKDLNGSIIIMGCKNDLRKNRVFNGELVTEEQSNKLAKKNLLDVVYCGSDDECNVRKLMKECLDLMKKQRQKKQPLWRRCLFCCCGEI